MLNAMVIAVRERGPKGTQSTPNRKLAALKKPYERTQVRHTRHGIARHRPGH